MQDLFRIFNKSIIILNFKQKFILFSLLQMMTLVRSYPYLPPPTYHQKTNRHHLPATKTSHKTATHPCYHRTSSGVPWARSDNRIPRKFAITVLSTIPTIFYTITTRCTVTINGVGISDGVFMGIIRVFMGMDRIWGIKAPTILHRDKKRGLNCNVLKLFVI